jgi:PAS domain-containing protein
MAVRGPARNSSGESPLALIADDGVVTAWARGAAELIGVQAQDAVGRRAEFFLGEDGRRVSAVADGLACHNGWSETVRTPLGEERNLRVTRLRRADGDVSWLLSAPSGTAHEVVAARSGAGRRLPGVAVWDRSLRCVMCDDVMEQAEGIARTGLGHRMAQILPGIDSDAFEAAMGNVLRTGSVGLDYRWEVRSSASHAHARTFLVSLFRLEGADGAGVGVCSLSVDVTTELEQRERLAVLGEASLRIGTSNDVMHTSQELADFAVPRIADYVTVDLGESVLLGEEPLALLDPDAGRIPIFHRAGVASTRRTCARRSSRAGSRCTCRRPRRSRGC